MEVNRLLLVIGFAIVLFILEQIKPLRNKTRSLPHRIIVNISMAALTYAAAISFVKPTINYFMGKEFGLLTFLDAGSPLQYILGFLLLDLSFYYWHRLNHKLDFLWRFHNCHHLDPDMDVSTAFRFHFAEVGLSSAFRGLQIAIISPALPVLIAYELVFQLGTFFHHANIKLPRPLESILMFFMVTPRIHGIHHSNYKNETDSNYSVVLNWWDRIHGSFRNDISEDEITIGVPGYADDGDNNLLNLIASPFKAQKDYWLDRVRRK